jgi:hypothetical protein
LHVLALRDNGTLWAWGYNGEGQLGNDSFGNSSWPAWEATRQTDWIGISAGDNHSRGLKRSGVAWAWGYNAFGQLGIGTTANMSMPSQVSGLADIIAIQAAGHHSLALRKSHSIASWGANNVGQLGTGATSGIRTTPATSPSGNNWVAITGGSDFTAGLQTGNRIYSWGDNQDGQIGNNSLINQSSPRQENTLSTQWTSIVSGFYQTFGLRQDGSLWGWGYNEFGQLGIGNTTVRVMVPTKSSWTYGVLNGGAPATPASTINLTSGGPLDWSQWGQPVSTTVNQRNIPAANLESGPANYTSPISMSRIGAVAAGGFTGAITYSWTNGKPTTSSSGTHGIYMTGVGNGWQITVPAGTTPRTLKVYVGVFKAQGRLVAHLSDGSAVDFTSTSLNNTTGTTNGVYTLTFATASNARNMTVKWTVNTAQTGGNITLQAATLQ